MERPSKSTLVRYFRGQCLPYEIKLVRLYLAMDIDKEFVESCLKEAWMNDQEDSDLEIDDEEVEGFKNRFYAKQKALKQHSDPTDNTQHVKPLFRPSSWMKVAAAAVIVLTTFTLIFYNKTNKTTIGQSAQKEDALPGSNKALLTLSDGSTISLSEAANGEIVEQAGLSVEKTAEGEIVYQAGAKASTTAQAYNTVTTPNGGQYRITLPDGTKARLNAASSLTYPIRFDEKERRVKMTGEVYFEVAKRTQANSKERMPFFVETEKQEVQVLGTHFNVNAYTDESVATTTLVEGSVRIVSTSGQSVVLRPGQQAIINNQIEVSQVDLEAALDWTKGDFVFKDQELQSILRKISRWYDVEIDCPPHLGKRKLTGMVSRNKSLSSVIESISSLGTVRLSLKERRITVEQ